MYLYLLLYFVKYTNLNKKNEFINFYTVSQKKQDTKLLPKYWPIFKILSLLDSVGNL